jgi:hypothetical protein
MISPTGASVGYAAPTNPNKSATPSARKTEPPSAP